MEGFYHHQLFESIAVISKKAVANYQALQSATNENRLCLAQCNDRRTGRPVYVVCETQQENGTVLFKPIARLFSGNPYNEVTPPGLAAKKLM